MKKIKDVIKSITRQFDELIDKEINPAKKDKLIYLKAYNIGAFKYLNGELEKLLWSD